MARAVAPFPLGEVRMRRKWTVAGLGFLIALMALSFNQSASDSNLTPDEMYIALVAHDFPKWNDYGTREDTITLGHTVCDSLDVLKEVDVSEITTETLPQQMSLVVIHSSIKIYCPEHLDDV